VKTCHLPNSVRLKVRYSKAFSGQLSFDDLHKRCSV